MGRFVEVRLRADIVRHLEFSSVHCVVDAAVFKPLIDLPADAEAPGRCDDHVPTGRTSSDGRAGAVRAAGVPRLRNQLHGSGPAKLPAGITIRRSATIVGIPSKAGLEVLAERWLSLPQTKRLEEICLTVVVVGNAVVDVAYQVERLPGSGETVLARERTVDVGGKGLNQAIMAHRAGAEVRFCAGLGHDPAADIIRACLEAEGLSTAWLVSVPCATDESIVYVARSGENCIVSTDEAARHLAPAHTESVLVGVAPGDVLLLQGNLSREVTGMCLARAHARGGDDHPEPSADRLRLRGPLAHGGHRDPEPDRSADADGRSRDRCGHRSPAQPRRRQGRPDPRTGRCAGARSAGAAAAPAGSGGDRGRHHGGRRRAGRRGGGGDRPRSSSAARRALGGRGGEPQGDPSRHQLGISDQR